MLKTHEYAIASMLLLFTGVAESIASDDGDLLASLRKEDEIVGQLFVECVRVIPTEWTGGYPRRERLKFTRRDRLYAIETVFDEVLIEGNTLPTSDHARGIGGPSSVQLVQYHLFNSEKSASQMVTALEHDAAGIPNKTGPTQTFQHVYGPDDVSETMFIFMPKWLLGRGFSEHLTSLNLVRTDDDGLLHVSGSGFFTPLKVGTWRLVLDPAHAMIAREAEFVRDGDTQPMLHVQTSGLLQSDPLGDTSAEFAAVGHYIQFHGRKPSSIDFNFHRVSLEMDEPFFTAIQDKFDEPLPSFSMLVDSRGKEDVYRVVTPETISSTPTGEPPGNGWVRRLFLINVALLGAVLFWWFLRLQRHSADK